MNNGSSGGSASACLLNGEFFNPVLTMGTQVSCLLVMSHFFQLLLRPLGQPAPVAQILAGFVLGPSCLSHIGGVRNFFFHNFAIDYYETLALYARIIIMFLIGLEIDFPYLRRHLRVAGIIAGGNSLICTIFAIAVTSFIYEETGAHGSGVMMAFTLAVVLSNTASPFVVRVAHDLRFASSDIGRLAISSSLISDAYAVLLLTIISKNMQQYDGTLWFKGFASLAIVVGVIFINKYFVNWLNSRNRDKKYLNNTEIFVLLAIVIVAATILETMGFSSIIGCFFMGSLFPRGGKAARTLLTKLSYSVQNFILPIYFGYTGFKADVTLINNFRNFAITSIVILLSIGGKVTGSLAGCFYLKIPLNEGVLLSFLMNLKGHVDLLALTIGVQTNVSSQVFYNLMMATVVINSLIWGPIIAFMVRRESDVLGHKHISLEFQSPESELKLLACVHGPRPVATMIGLIATCKGHENVAINPYLMHLIELPEKKKTNLLYHQKEEDELSDDDNYGGNDVLEINEAVDIFAVETGVMIHQVKVISPFATMYDDLCEFAEDIRASIIFLPFHKHQRIDGKLESGKEGIRTTNQKVLRYAKCAVGILVDRGLTTGTSHSDSLQHVATLFFGGPDDREALGLSKRLGMHHHINLTIIRFLHISEKSKNLTQNKGVNTAPNEDDVLMAISSSETERNADDIILTDFYNRYVTTGEVGYVEKHVEDGAGTASALRDMADMYSMFIIGKGGREHSALTTGMSDWEECPELGKVGDFLASSDFDLSGSVLVIQQHRPSKNEEDEDV